VVAADVWINCPVMKTHGPKITVAMKNRFGLLPGAVYGMSKNQGTESHPPMPHKPANVEESMVDIWLAEPEDLVVVDGIVGREEGALFDGEPLRTNQVLAGTNPVAVDLTAAYLMGFNPDDMEFAMLAARTGHGPRWFEEVEVRGADPDRLRRRFKKAGSAYGGILFGDEWEQIAGYGRTPRHWSLMGPLPADHEMTAAEIASLTPIPGEGGWSDPVWFGDDKIDLDERFDDPSNVVVYAFTWFRMARADSVRFWAGSDEGLQVWIDGETVYEHTERRQHVLGEDRSAGFLDAGEHRLLVRVHQRRGPFEFSFAICEPIDDPLFAGNTPAGLRYYPDRRRPDEF
jgi:hypothetical protein